MYIRCGSTMRGGSCTMYVCMYVYTYVYTYEYISHKYVHTMRQYDARGELHDWWSDDTVAKYKTRSQCIADLFSTYSIGALIVHI